MPTNKKIKVLMLASEASPYAKVGGLGDVLGSLPAALKKNGCDVCIFLPKYRQISERKFQLKKIISQLEIPTGSQKVKINVWRGIVPEQGLKAYFIDYPEYFKGEVYEGNNSERFLFFSLAALYALPAIRFQPDILHCHDFHTALATDILKVSNLYSGYLKSTKSIYTIHNLNYQGISGLEVLSTGNLKTDSLAALSEDAKNGDINFMVQGIINADLFNTVSPGYAKEIATSTYGASLEKVIKANQHKLSGILNGIDTKLFNPAKDKFLKKKFSLKNIKNKTNNKTYLQKKLGLTVGAEIPLFGLVSRLVWQKGLELITAAEMDKLLAEKNCQFVFLGTGEKKYEEQLSALAKKYPKNISFQPSFDLGLAQLIYGASDFFLMPSRFEPCGLGQMIAMRYGSIPVVRATGGLNDTVNSQTGFKFKDFETEALFASIRQAVSLYYKNKEKFFQIRKNCLKKDFSWDASAKEYIKLYRKALYF